MPTYDITSHPILNPKAKALVANHPEVFTAQVDSAELIHDLVDTAFTDSKAELAKLILVYQVNLQIENGQVNEIYKRAKEGDREYEYKDQIAISEMSVHLREKLTEDETLENQLKERRGNSTSKESISLW